MLPACLVVAAGHVSTGIAMCIGLLPVGLAGMRSGRRGRIVAASAGVLFAAFLLVGSARVGLVLVATIATRTSRWYVASAGTSYLVLTMLLYGAPGAAVQSTFWGRVGAAFVGVGLAYVFGVLVPKALAARSRTER